MVNVLLLALSLLFSSSASAFCFDKAAAAYGVPANVLSAIAFVESSFRPDAVNRSHAARTGTRDIGLMQINSGHLPRLAPLGITEATLLSDPCQNVLVGAWLLAEKVRRFGPTWEAVGAYNASCTTLRGDDCRRARNAYSTRVYHALQRQAAQRGLPPSPPQASPSEPPGLALLSFSLTPDPKLTP